jgi:flagellar motor switch protein FliG
MTMSAKKLSGSDKAAVLLLALGDDLASQILGQLDPRDVKPIVSALSRLGRVDEEQARAVLEEFQQLLTRPAQRQLAGGGEAARRIIEAAGRVRGEELGIELEDGSSALRETLAAIDAKTLAGYLRREHPQTMALVLAHLDGKKCGDTLKLLPETLHVELIERVARLEVVDPAILVELEESLRAELERESHARQRPIGGATQVAQMIAGMDKASGERFLDALEERDPKLAEAVRAQLFTFADLVRLDEAGLRLLIAQTPRRTLLLAMKEAPAAVRELILRNVSERARKTLLEDVEAQGKVRREDVEAAQRDMATLVRKLEGEGKLTIPDGDEKMV